MKQKVKRALLVLMSVMTIGFAKAQTIVTVDGLQYSLAGAYASVVGVADGNTSEVITIPSILTYNSYDYSVTSIGERAFYGCRGLSSVIIPNSVTSIGKRAFQNCGLKSVNIPNSIREIKNAAFLSCMGLTSVSFGNSLTTIGESAFMNCNLKSVIIGNAVTEIGNYAFDGNPELTHAVISASVTSFGDNIFESCNLLRSIVYLGATPPTNWVATSQTYVPNTNAYSTPKSSINSAQVIPMINWNESVFTYNGKAPVPTWTTNIEGYTATAELPTLGFNAAIYSKSIPFTFTKGEESFEVNIPYTYTINPVKLTAKVGDASRIYGEPNPTFNITYSGFVNGETQSVLTTLPSANTTATPTSSVGTYPITLTGGRAENYTFEYESGVLTVNKAPLNIQVANATKVYGQNNPSFSLKYSGLKNNETAPAWVTQPAYTTNADTNSDVGIYNVTVTCDPKNYSIASNQAGTLTVTQAPVTIKANNVTMDYGGAMPTYTYQYSGFINDDTEAVLSKLPSIVTDATASSDAGTYTITPNGAEAKNYAFTYTPGTLTIKQRKLSAKAISTNRIYGEPNPTFNITYSGYVNGETQSVLTTLPTASTTATISSSVGAYPITISGGVAKNYTFEYEQGTLTVNKAPLNMQVENASKVYGQNNPSFSLKYSGLKNGETAPAWISQPTYTTAADKKSDVGSYDVTATCDPKNYSIASNQAGKLTVTPATLTIKANNATMDYGGAMPTYTYQYSGFMNNDTEAVLSKLPSIVTDATAGSDAGTYTITPDGAEAKNYTFNYTSGTLTIKQRSLLVKANNESRLYGENNPVFTLKYEGFVNNETKNVLEMEPVATTSADVRSNVGIYDINVNGGRAKNYMFSYQSGQLSITPRALKASVGNYERPYGEENPVFAIIYEGLAGNDTEASLTNKPMTRTLATKTSDVGTYDIEVTGGYSPNYTLSYGSGKLNIVKAEQTIDWSQDLSNLKVGDQVELLAVASSKLPVTYTLDDENCAEIYNAGSKTYMECKAPGTFHIKAVQNGSDNYFSTQRISKTVTVVAEGEYNPTLFIKQSDKGVVGTKVDFGSNQTFTIYAEAGWKIHSVTFNDVDVTDQLDEQGKYTTPAITENSTLRVAYEATDGNEVHSLAASNVKVQPMDFGVRVLNAQKGDVVSIYTVEGSLVKTVRVESELTDIDLPSDQVYIIKVKDLSVKVRP